MGRLSSDDIEELSALQSMNDALNGPSFLMRSHWRESAYRRLVSRGLAAWGDPPPGFDKRKFAGVTITDAGRQALHEANP